MTFDNQGNLYPYELIQSNLIEMSEHLGGTQKRDQLLVSFDRYLDGLLASLNCSFEQLIGGSFGNCRTHPNDIDVANLIALPDPDDETIESIMPFLTLGGSIDSFSVDGHLIPVYDKSDERYTNTIARLRIFESGLGSTAMINQEVFCT